MAFDTHPSPLLGAYGEPCATEADVQASRALWQADQDELAFRDDEDDRRGVRAGMDWSEQYT